MGHDLTSCDLVWGHNHLAAGHLRHITMIIVKHMKISRYCFIEKIVATFKFCWVKFLLFAMTLNKGSRSNGCHVKKGIDKYFLSASLFDCNPFSFWMGRQCFPHWITCKNWTLTHKTHKVGHGDLIFCLQGKGPLRSSHTWYGPPISKNSISARWGHFWPKCELQILLLPKFGSPLTNSEDGLSQLFYYICTT